MRVVILGSGRGSNAEAILLAQEVGNLGRARVVQILADKPEAGILALGPRFGVPASYVDPAPFKTKLDGEAEQRGIHGQASLDEAAELLEEGSAILPILDLPGDRN
jgi:phosphoribosylglycinamide formyltransferase-1